MAAKAKPAKEIAFQRQPANGAPGDINLVVLSAERISTLRLSLLNAKGGQVGKVGRAEVTDGQAVWAFFNPSFSGRFFLVVQDQGGALTPVHSEQFDVAAAVEPPAPEPEPEPPAPEPEPPAPEPEPPAPEPEPPAPEPEPPAPEPEPPAPEPAPQPAILAVEADMASAKVGQPLTVRVRAQDIQAVEWVTVQSDKAWSWRGTPVTLILREDGTGEFEWTPLATGELVKVMAFGARSIYRDSAMVPASAAVVPAPAPSGDAAVANSFMTGLRHGMNVERWRPVTMKWNGKPLASDPAYWEYLRGIGLTHVRGFCPVHFQVDMIGKGLLNGKMPDDGLIDQFLQPWRTASKAGLKVFLDICDVQDSGNLGRHWKAFLDYMTRFSRRVAAAPELGPDRLAIGPFNELAAGKNADYNNFRIEAHRAIRAVLPQHVIVHGAADWDNWRLLVATDWAPPPDFRAIGQWHHYLDANSGLGFWQDVQRQLRAWSKRNGGMPSACGEAGFDEFWADPKHKNYSDRWLRAVRDQANGIPCEAPMWWAVTSGSDYRCNKTAEDLTLIPEVEAVLRETLVSFDGAR